MKPRKSLASENGHPAHESSSTPKECDPNEQGGGNSLSGSSLQENTALAVSHQMELDVANGEPKTDENGVSNEDTGTASVKQSNCVLNGKNNTHDANDAGDEENLKMKDIDTTQVEKMKASKNRRKDDIRESRKRKVKQVSSTEDVDSSRWLRAFNEKGREIKLKITISSRTYVHEMSNSDIEGGNDLGNDGNQHYCQVCRGFGDVVCCDGCPRVYHHDCLPIHSTSREALENDADPWFCPKCVEKAKKNQSKKDTKKGNGSDKLERSSASRRCVDCRNIRDDIKLTPCVDCGAYIHFPHCYGSDNTMDAMSTKPVCRNCKVIDQDESMSSDISASKEKHNGKKMRMDDSDTDGSTAVEEKVVSLTKEKKTLNVKATLLGTTNKKSSELDKKLKKKKKSRKRSASEIDQITEEDEAARQQSIKDDPILQPRGSSTGVQAIPAFCFYLAENRWKIERSLSRKHRTFLRLPKGDERNALVAQEAAIWWTKLEPSEHKLYIQMAIRDFESRVIAWKEEKIAKESRIDDDEAVGDFGDDSEYIDGATKLVDLQHTYNLHERLYLSTSVGSKSFKLESGHNYNRVLMDLLHDIRFNPLPMLNVNRPDIDSVLSEKNKRSAIPFFEVHGPISTYVGDECLGCSRGWTHFCTVLQRKIPAVEYRAKLQPPLSSLLATRIGLGLRPKLEEMEGTTTGTEETQKSKLFQWRETNDNNGAKGLFNVPSCHVFDPNDRIDDMVLFIEENVAMKIPEPPRPANPNIQKKAAIRVLPTQRQREGQIEGDDVGGDNLMNNKCGRCRTMIQNDAGCVPCRRAQLVINKSKITPFVSPKNGEGKSLKVHTVMLGRLHAKDSTSEAQNTADQRVAQALLKQRWFPSAILPPQTIKIPTPTFTDIESVIDTETNGEFQVDEDLEVMDVDEGKSKNENDAAKKNVFIVDAKGLLELAEIIDRVTNSEQAKYELPATRVRSARSMSMVDKETIVSEPDRPQLQKHYKKETVEIMRKMTRIACLGIMHAVIRRDPLRIFEEIDNAEGSAGLVQNQTTLKVIRGRVLAGNYESVASFVADIRNLCDGAISSNPPTTIYYKTAKEISSILPIMHSRASAWISTIRSEKIKSLQSKESADRGVDDVENVPESDDPFAELRMQQPHAVWMLDQEERLRSLVESDFRRTAENETSYYGCLSIGRAAAAAEASLAPYPDSSGQHTVVPLRKHFEDEDLRDHVDKKVSGVKFPQLRNVSTWREELILRLVRKVQKLRLDYLQNTDSGCSRLSAIVVDRNVNEPTTINADVAIPVTTKRKIDQLDTPRVASSRGLLVTGLASAKTCQRILQRSLISGESDYSAYASISDVCVSVRGSKIHGIGLFADQPFAKGDVVAEYVGESIVTPISILREKLNEENRVQDYQFRLDDTYAIDATTRGSWARYINHSCAPNCKTVIIPGHDSNPQSRRVMIVAKRSIEFNEELSYDYQFPLELDLNARIPCNCQSDSCRGFMNWDLPEKGSNNRILLVHKRGANMRDRIRRLGRPLKKDEM